MTLSKYWFTGLPISLVSSLRDPCEGALFHLDIFLFVLFFVGGNSCDSGFSQLSLCSKLQSYILQDIPGCKLLCSSRGLGYGAIFHIRQIRKLKSRVVLKTTQVRTGHFLHDTTLPSRLSVQAAECRRGSFVQRFRGQTSFWLPVFQHQPAQGQRAAYLSAWLSLSINQAW